MWAIGCTLYELYTGKILFPGRTNNQMLKLIQETKGPFPKKMLRKGTFSPQHFDDSFHFLQVEKDTASGKEIVRPCMILKATKDMKTRLMSGSSAGDVGAEEERRMVAEFADLMEKCLVLSPDKRLTVQEALVHPFVRAAPHAGGVVVVGLIPSWMKIKFPSNWAFERKFGSFENTNSSAFAICDTTGTYVYLADSGMCREVMVGRYKEFVKPVEHYGVLDVYGKNIVTTEGAEWRKHRKIAAPTFSESNNALVHEASVKIAQEMFHSWEYSFVTTNHGSGHLVNVSSDMMEFALSVISTAAFGIDIPWHEANDLSALRKGHKMTFKQSLEIVVSRLQFWLLIPRVCYRFLPFQFFRDTWTGFIEFEQYLDGIIDDAQENVTEKPKNLLQMLARAVNDEKDDRAKLTRSELKGNSFVFLFAGHETTAGTLAFALALLALHPDKQDALHSDIKTELGDAEFPQYKDFSNLKHPMAVMNETLRFFPPVTGIPKITSTETLTLGPFVFPPNTNINIVTPGLHFNPANWGSDAGEFKPERFLDSDEGASRLGFAPFSEGPRGCVGKKFAQVEMVALLTMISLKYRVCLADPVDAEHLLDTVNLLTLRAKNPIKLVFVPR
ncbi:hypothetical protein HDU98_002555 [Podochytrium sp. JEL0797]|nr:hypothetical protein HDU98_002555 [Podochytrium sp. JEL0797]